jgi:CheY-like chemotaxis protein
VQSEEASREINFIQKSAQTLTEMVNDLLDLAKAESGKLLVHLTEFEVDSVFSALRGMMRPLATSDAVELIFEDPGSVPPLHSDETLISQILRNLFSNALKFTERGEVRVSAAYSADRDAISFSVRDTGIGIPVEHQKRIFEEFAQLDNPLQRKVKGTGLGLPLCKKLAELLGGSIHVESEAGVGSCFTAVIPRRYSGAEYSLTSASPSRPERTILLIDDEDVSRYLLRQLLDGPYRVVEAKSGLEGIEQAHKVRPDVIFLDLNMPGMSGFEVVTHLKAAPGLREIPVVVVTGQKLDPVAQAALAQKTVAFLAKDVLARAEALSIDFGPPLSISPRYPGPSGD